MQPGTQGPEGAGKDARMGTASALSRAGALKTQDEVKAMLAEKYKRMQESLSFWMDGYPEGGFPKTPPAAEPGRPVKTLPARENGQGREPAQAAEARPVQAQPAQPEKTGTPAHTGLIQAEPLPWAPLPGMAPSEPFPMEALPLIGHGMVMAVADSVQVSPDMAACLMLGVGSSAAAGKAAVRVSEAHEEPCQVFIAVGANPSERKSACMAALFEPLYRYAREENERRAPLIRHSANRREVLENRLAQAKRAGDTRQANEVSDELAAMEEVKPYELMLSDATTEALAQAMARNGGRMAVVSSEGAQLGVLLGMYNKGGEANLDVVLKGYSGEPLAVARVGRVGEQIQKASLSLCLAVQPDILSTFLNNQNLAARGMASRFLAAMPSGMVGKRSPRGCMMDEDVLTDFNRRVTDILRHEGPITLALSGEAWQAWEAWFLEVEAALKPGGVLAEVGQGWGGKLCGNTARVAGLLSLLKGDWREVSGETMRGAVQIARWFQAHALRLMGGEDTLSPEAREALHYLLKRGLPEVPLAAVRNVLRKRKAFLHGDAVNDVIGDLAAAGYLRLAAAPPTGAKGRQFGSLVQLHPDLLAKDA